MNRRFSLVVLLLILATASFGCSIYHVNSEEVSTEYYPPKKNAQDIVYLEKVDKPHEVISNIIVNAERNQKMNDVIEKMKREAAIVGADAITDIKTDATGTWKHLPAQSFVGNGYVRANFKASAVVFK